MATSAVLKGRSAAARTHHCHGCCHVAFCDCVHGRADYWHAQAQLTCQLGGQRHLQRRSLSQSNTEWPNTLKKLKSALKEEYGWGHLMSTKVDVSRMENDIIVCVSDALAEQPGCRDTCSRSVKHTSGWWRSGFCICADYRLLAHQSHSSRLQQPSQC